jgi:hypothetical protein
MYEAPSSNPILPRKKINKKKRQLFKKIVDFLFFFREQGKGNQR